LPDWILLSVISRFLTTRPIFTPLPVRHGCARLAAHCSICAKLAITWKKKRPAGIFGIDTVGQALKVHVSTLKLSNQGDQAFDRSAKTIQFPNYQGIIFAQM
jgi:hypothetical protein